MAKSFHFAIEASVSLSVEEIWPDGDAPANPSLADVINVIRTSGGASAVIQDWNLLGHQALTVSDERNSEVVK